MGLQVSGHSTGDKIGNFFANMLDADYDALKGGVGVLSAPYKYLTGGTVNWKEIGRDYENFGLHTADSFTDSHNFKKDPSSQPDPAMVKAQNQAKVLQSVSSTTNPLNARNFGNFSASISSQLSGPGFGSNLGAPPSAVMKIAHPATKLAMASSRGDERTHLNTKLRLNDVASQNGTNTNYLAKNSAGGTANPATSTEPSSGTPGGGFSGAS